MLHRAHAPYLQVVQYILDLNDNRFSDAVIRQFTGNVCALSVQKFSSNVIEKVCRLTSTSYSFNNLVSVYPCRGAFDSQDVDWRTA